MRWRDRRDGDGLGGVGVEQGVASSKEAPADVLLTAVVAAAAAAELTD